MSHFSVLTILPKGTPADLTSVEAATSRLLAPYDENTANNSRARWDWWQIGGRWTGALSGYEPTRDPANYDPCSYCGGTGTRSDAVGRKDGGMAWTLPSPEEAAALPFPVIGKGCNACQGTGFQLAHGRATEGGLRDVKLVRDIPETFAPFAVVTPDDGWIEKGRMGWWATVLPDEDGNAPKSDNEWQATYTRILARYAPDHLAVLVDCHI